MTNTVPIVTGKRAQLAAIAADSQRDGLTNAVPTPGFLRSEVPMTSPYASIDFPILLQQTANGAPTSSTEVRLVTNDAFYVTGIALMFYTVAAAAPTQAQRARARLQQFPNSAVFAANTPEIQAAYNGNLTISQNNKIFLRQAPLAQMEYVDLAQQGVGGAVASSTEWPKGFLPTDDPMIRLNGQSDIQATAQFPDAVALQQVANSVVYAVLIMVGWRVQNGGVARTVRP